MGSALSITRLGAGVGGGKRGAHCPSCHTWVSSRDRVGGGEPGGGSLPHSHGPFPGKWSVLLWNSPQPPHPSVGCRVPGKL